MASESPKKSEEGLPVSPHPKGVVACSLHHKAMHDGNHTSKPVGHWRKHEDCPEEEDSRSNRKRILREGGNIQTDSKMTPTELKNYRLEINAGINQKEHSWSESDNEKEEKSGSTTPETKEKMPYDRQSEEKKQVRAWKHTHSRKKSQEPLAKWNQRLEELKEYKSRHGDCLVPQRFPENPQLGTWVNTQRRHYKLLQEGKRSSMTPQRIADLEAVGFQWKSPKLGSLEMQLEELRRKRAERETSIGEDVKDASVASSDGFMTQSLGTTHGDAKRTPTIQDETPSKRLRSTSTWHSVARTLPQTNPCPRDMMCLQFGSFGAVNGVNRVLLPSQVTFLGDRNGPRRATGRTNPSIFRGAPTVVSGWECSICGEARFLTYEEALIHEAHCAFNRRR